MSPITEELDRDLTLLLDEQLTEPTEGARTVRDLIERLRQRDFDQSDRILHALLSRLDTDPQARILVLHAMQPALTSLAHKHHRRHASSIRLDDALCHVIDALYDALENPSVRAKRTHVAARIIGETRTVLAKHLAADFSTTTVCWDSELALSESTLLTPEPTTVHDSQLDLLEALAWARDHEVISLDEARFMIAIYSPDCGLSLDELDLPALSPAAIRKRASRLAQRIARAVLEDPEAASSRAAREELSR